VMHPEIFWHRGHAVIRSVALLSPANGRSPEHRLANLTRILIVQRKLH
jgi:hypothetical protein